MPVLKRATSLHWHTIQPCKLFFGTVMYGFHMDQNPEEGMYNKNFEAEHHVFVMCLFSSVNSVFEGGDNDIFRFGFGVLILRSVLFGLILSQSLGKHPRNSSNYSDDLPHPATASQSPYTCDRELHSCSRLCRHLSGSGSTNTGHVAATVRLTEELFITFLQGFFPPEFQGP